MSLTYFCLTRTFCTLKESIIPYYYSIITLFHVIDCHIVLVIMLV